MKPLQGTKKALLPRREASNGTAIFREFTVILS